VITAALTPAVVNANAARTDLDRGLRKSGLSVKKQSHHSREGKNI
jgi:hypothetical protein